MSISINASAKEYGRDMEGVVDEIERQISLMDKYQEEMVESGIKGGLTQAYTTAHQTYGDSIKSNAKTIREVGQRLQGAEDMAEELNTWAEEQFNQQSE